jgi:predicted Fe-S protein YdhL (DUF1289 family)
MKTESPCIGICTLQHRGRTCIGCGRTLSEIAQWPQLTFEERRAIMATLPQRLRELRQALQ